MWFPVGIFTSKTRSHGHSGWMRRFALMATTAGLVTLGGGWYALGAAGKDQPAAPVAAAKTPLVAPQSEDEVSLPPLPSSGSRAKAVEPVAGAANSTADDTAAADPSLSSTTDAKPTREASAAVPADLVRLSCGIEDPADLVADLAQAMGLPVPA